MTNSSNAVADYPIIGCTNYGGVARYRLWNENLNSGSAARGRSDDHRLQRSDPTGV